jgi:uncharacterized damage-inducible protein DinB
MQQVFQPVTPEQAAWRAPGSIANTIGATFTHVYVGEDQLVHGTTSTPTIFASGGWAERLGYDPETMWTYTGTFNPPVLLEYAAAVSAVTQDYLAGLSEEALEQLIDTPRGPQPRVNRLSVYLVVHKFQHMGEIAALLGCQGAKGLPF